MTPPPTFLCLASYFKGGRFIERCKQEGCTTYLLTVERVLNERWPRHALDDVFALPDFADRKALTRAVAYLMRTRRIDRVVALDDFDVEDAALLREHFGVVGHGESAARLFRDKLAMRRKARGLGVRIPDFTGLAHHQDVTDFLVRTPGPYLVKPRGEAGAVGIAKCAAADDVWRRVHELGDEQSFHLAEQMVPGDLYHVDSLVEDGKVVFAEVNAYWKPLLDVYQGGGVYATRTLDRASPDVARLRALNERVLAGFGLGWGASHTEFMKSHADGEFYFIETSCRVGGAETATMVEAATGVNLWSEWAALEIARTAGGYQLPPLKQRHAGVVISLANTETPDTSAYTDPEVVRRLDTPHHVGLVVAADSARRVEELLTDYTARVRRDFTAVLPAEASSGR